MHKNQLRPDLKHLAKLVKKESRVLEIGCGDGDLLYYLTHEKNIDGRGIEISQSGVSTCVKRGLSVIQGDADVDLKFYPQECFDFAISSQVIQATRNPKDVLQEMMRVSKSAVIAIPNFGYWFNRVYLGLNGRMPVSSTLSYQWYETPNIHFSTAKDFEALCAQLGYKITKSVYLQASGKPLKNPIARLMPNLFAEKAIFVLEK